MFERLAERVARMAARRAEERIADMAGRVAAELPPDIAAEAQAGGVRLSGRGLRRRFALEPALRWLALRQAQDARGGWR